MGGIYQKYCMMLSFLSGSFLMFPWANGAFKKMILQKPFNISMKTKQFLKEVELMQRFVLVDMQNLSKDKVVVGLVHSMVQIHEQIMSSSIITPEDIGHLLDLVAAAKKILFDHQIEKFTENIAKFDVLWIFLKNSLKRMQAFGFEQDLKFLSMQLDQLNVNNFKIHDVLVSSVGVCSDIMYRFDGVMLTDYDFLVLANLAITLAVISN